MKRLFSIWMCLFTIGFSSKIQAQKDVKVDDMIYRIIGENEVALVGGSIKTEVYSVLSTILIDGKEYQVTELRNQKDNKPVYSVKSEQFGPTVRKMILPNTIRTIGYGTFHNHTKLVEIVLPLSLVEIGYSAFWNCTSLVRLNGLNSTILFYDISGKSYSLKEFVKAGKARDHFGTFQYTPIPLNQIENSFRYYALGKIKRGLEEWQCKKEFETVKQWKTRVTVATRDKKVQDLLASATQEYVQSHSLEKLNAVLGDYDADYRIFPVEFVGLGTQYLQVPAEEAPAFKEKFRDVKFTPRFGVKDDLLAIISVEAVLDGKTYNSRVPVNEKTQELSLNLPALDVNISDNHNRQDSPVQSVVTKSDVDENIPVSSNVMAQTFAVVIANENYVREAQVPFAFRDGEVFAEYCRKTLGIPEKNIRVVKDATLNDMKFQFDWLRQILGAYNGHARAIVYYAGHGIPDETNQSACLLPVDGYGSNVGTGFALKDFYATLNSAPAECVTVFLDACFSGTKRESGMMATARGVAIKVKEESPKGNMVVFTAAQGDETAYQYAEKGHGMFTYFLLKKLQESKGSVTLGELSDYISGEVRKSSILINNKMQTPTTIASPGMAGWRDNTLK